MAVASWITMPGGCASTKEQQDASHRALFSNTRDEERASVYRVLGLPAVVEAGESVNAGEAVEVFVCRAQLRARLDHVATRSAQTTPSFAGEIVAHAQHARRSGSPY
jgi:hypothetical protein